MCEDPEVRGEPGLSEEELGELFVGGSEGISRGEARN